MATFTALSVYSMGSRAPSLTTSPSRSQRCAGAITTVKAMGPGVAKYKGTQVREKRLTEMIEKKIMEAKQVCEGDRRHSDECKVAWDEVEEVSQAKADLRLKLNNHQDPLESFCLENPDTDECAVQDNY